MAKAKRTALSDVRNIGIAAHIDAGKTTLTERILYYTGASHKIGEVHDGDAHMDYMPEEQAHGITITSAVTKCPWDGKLIQVVDTPGHVDFTIEVERAMRVLDGAVIVMDGVRGVEPQTETVWRQAERFSIPRLIFVNKMDRPGASYDRAMETLEKRLNGIPVPVCVPLEDESVIDLIESRLLRFSGTKGETVEVEEIPEEAQEIYDRHRETLLLACAEVDPELEEAVLEERPIAPQALRAALRTATLQGLAHPVFGGSALRNWGVQPVLANVNELLPSPLDRPSTLGRTLDDEEVDIEMKDDGPLVALAFKVQLLGGRRHVFARVYRGTLKPGDQVCVAGQRKGAHKLLERVGRVLDVDANAIEALTEARAGQIVVLAGLKTAATGDTLCAPNNEILLERIDAKDPVLGLAVEPESSGDEDKFQDVLAKVCEEDPTLVFEEDEETGQRILKGMGELHLIIVFERLQREFGLKVRAGKPLVMTRETISGAGIGDVTVDRVLKIDDDAVQLKARAKARVSPRSRGAGIEIICNPTVLPQGQSMGNQQRIALETGTNDGVSAGPIEGAPLQDLKVELVEVELFGSASTPQAMRIVASQAVRAAMANGGGVLLRPLMRVEVVVPDENMGSVLGDLQSRQALISGQESDMGMTTILGECPLHQLLGYTTELRSLTRGRGQFTMEFARFDVA